MMRGKSQLMKLCAFTYHCSRQKNNIVPVKNPKKCDGQRTNLWEKENKHAICRIGWFAILDWQRTLLTRMFVPMALL